MPTSENTKNLEAHLLLRLPDVLDYLKLPSLWATLMGLAVIVTILDFLASGIFGFFPALLAAGLEIGFFFHITKSSANGDTEFNAPDFVDIYDSILQPIFLVIAAALPMVVALYWATTEVFASGLPTSGWPIGPVVLFFTGLALFPLLLTIAAIDGTIFGVLNPVVWFRSLRFLGTNYIVAAVGFYGLWALEVYVITEMAEQVESLPVFGISVIALMLYYVPRVLRYRLLGALCEPFLSGPIDHVVVLSDNFAEADVDDSVERLQELESGGMQPRAILRMANTAISKKRYRLVYRSVEYLWKHHPDSPEIVQALWVASLAQEQEGQIEAMKSTLSRLVTSHGHHPMAGEAEIKLRRFS